MTSDVQASEDARTRSLAAVALCLSLLVMGLHLAEHLCADDDCLISMRPSCTPIIASVVLRP